MNRTVSTSRGCGPVPAAPCQQGFSLVEVVVAMAILSIGLTGAMGAFQWADRDLQRGAKGTRALALVESKLEAKRMAPWTMLLVDDLDLDGTFDVIMRDDGIEPDQGAGDGIFTASQEVDGIRLTWTVQLDRTVPLASVGSATIEARASYLIGPSQGKEVRLATARANPRFVGTR